MASEDLSGEQPRPLGRESPKSGLALLCGLCSTAWSWGPHAVFEHGNDLDLGVPLPPSLLIPTWGDNFSFSLVKVTLLLATGEQLPSEALPSPHYV